MPEQAKRAKRKKWAPQQRVHDVNRAAILDCLARVGPFSFTDLLEAVPCSRPVFAEHLARLEDQGLVEGKQAETGDRRRVFYSVTLKGRVEADRTWLLLLTLDQMARRDARTSTGLPYAGPGFVTHVVTDADCGEEARWLSEGLADVAWEGVYRGLARHILRELDKKYPPTTGAEPDQGKAEARGKAFFEVLDGVVRDTTSKGEHRVIVALEVDLPVLATQLGRHPRQHALLKVYRKEQRRAAAEEEAKAAALGLGLDHWSAGDLPHLRRRFQAKERRVGGNSRPEEPGKAKR